MAALIDSTMLAYSSDDNVTEDDDGCGSDHSKDGPNNSPNTRKGISHLLPRDIVADPLGESVTPQDGLRLPEIHPRGIGKSSEEEPIPEIDADRTGRELQEFLDGELPRRILEELRDHGEKRLDERDDLVPNCFHFFPFLASH